MFLGKSLNLSLFQYLDLETKRLSKVLCKVLSGSKILVVCLGLSFIWPECAALLGHWVECWVLLLVLFFLFARECLFCRSSHLSQCLASYSPIYCSVEPYLLGEQIKSLWGIIHNKMKSPSHFTRSSRMPEIPFIYIFSLRHLALACTLTYISWGHIIWNTLC